MPRGDRTGPFGRGPGTGRPALGRRGGGIGGGGRSGIGPGGNCICPSCGERLPHQVGTPCTYRSCPKCGTALVRE